MNSEQFMGKVAIVTGAAKGIGLAAVTRFAGDGADIVAVDLPGASFADASAAAAACGRTIVTVEADVTKQNDWENVVAQAVGNFGRIDILINNAGIFGIISRFEEIPIDVFDQVMNVNVRGVFLGMQAVIPTMRAQGGGHIVNVSSISGERGSARGASYITSKHAVNGLTQSVALDVIKDGIHVNAVAPAPTDTDMVRLLEDSASKRTGGDYDAARKMIENSMVIGRYGQPKEIAAAMAFLCSTDASFVTGVILPVDGGALAK